MAKAVDPSRTSAERLADLIELFAIGETLEIAIVERLREIERAVLTL